MAATEWVEIIEPRTKEHMFANLTTGECVWEVPVGVPVKKTDDNQWWELFDQNTSRFYYYNASSQKTVWHKPTGCDIIPLAKLQTLKQNTEPKDTSSKRRDTVGSETSTLTNLSTISSGGETKSVVQNTAQTSPTHTKSKRQRQPRCRAHSTTCSISSSSLPSHAKSKSKSETAVRSAAGGGGGRKSTAAATSNHRSTEPDKSANPKRNSVGQTSIHSADRIPAPQDRLAGYPAPPDRLAGADRLSLDGGKSGYGNVNGGVKYYPGGGGKTAGGIGGNGGHYSSGRFSNAGYVYQVPLSKQRSLEGENFRILQSPPGQEGSLSRSISFMAGKDGKVRNGEVLDPARRSVESTPQSSRRYPLVSPEGDYRRIDPSIIRHHSRNSSISSVGASTGLLPAGSNKGNHVNPGKSNNHSSNHSNVDGFPTPMINRRPVGGQDPRRVIPSQQTSESEDSSNSPHKERKRRMEGVDSGLSTLTDPDIPRSNHNLHVAPSRRPERSLTSLSLQVKKWKNRAKGNKSKEAEELTNSSKPYLAAATSHNNFKPESSNTNKISPLQQYILEQAKLSGYRFGDKVVSGKRDSFIDSESESHRTGDDSDAFADDEAPSSDGYEDRDDVSLVSTVSSVGDEDMYLTAEPTYNNLDPVWAQRHGFGTADNSLGVDAFSEEFDLRMRIGGRSSTHSTIPRPTHSIGGTTVPSSLPPSLPHRPGSVAQFPGIGRDAGDGRLDFSPLMSTSHLSDNTGSTLSVSASIHSTLSAGTLADLENFAASNLNIQKKGIFRKKMSLKDVLSWQSEAISKPLTFVREKGLKKEAVTIFKLVQIYMSDRKAKIGMTINSVAMDIAESGYNNVNLRDEVYIQLCKQTSENPRRESLRRGWELIAICLAFFPPSESFFPYLLGFIQKHRDPNLDFPEIGQWPIHVQISHYAGICAKRLERVGTGGRLLPRKPSLEDIDQSRLQIFRPSMFGGTLQEILDIQKDKFPTRRIPWILTTLRDQILELNGLTTEGIFRIPADFDEVSSSKCRYDQWEVSSCSDAHVPAGLLKMWLRELYVPLIPDDNLYAEAILAGEDTAAALAVVDKLPEIHSTVLHFLIRFLQLFIRPEVVSVTKMDSSNLSMVFAPNFLRCPSSDPIVIMENTRKEMAFVKSLIHGLDTESVKTVL